MDVGKKPRKSDGQFSRSDHNAAAPTTHGRQADGATVPSAKNSPAGSFWRGNRTALKQGADADGLDGERVTVPSNRRNAARPRRDVATHSDPDASEQTPPHGGARSGDRGARYGSGAVPGHVDDDPRLTKLRDCAARGLTRAQSATETGIPYNTVAWIGNENGIEFRRATKGVSPAPIAPRVKGPIPTEPKTLADFARIENAAMRRRQA